MSNLALETLRYCLVAFTGITSGSTSNGEDSPGESILEALNESGESDDWDNKGYDSDHYDAAMRKLVAIFCTKVAMPLDNWLLASSWLEISLTTSSCLCL
jgi:hypothetical protein